MASDLASGATSAEQLTSEYLARISLLNPAVNAFITVLEERAMEQARGVDQGDNPHPLAGIPMAHKDIFCAQDVRTTCGSRMLDNFFSPYDATVVTKLQACGAVMLGKTNMDEFAMGSSNENSFYGAVRNPWDQTRVPGGSSGGSAAAVAAGMVPYATGTDTHHGLETDLWPGFALWYGGFCLEFGSGRYFSPISRGCRFSAAGNEWI